METMENNKRKMNMDELINSCSSPKRVKLMTKDENEDNLMDEINNSGEYPKLQIKIEVQDDSYEQFGSNSSTTTSTALETKETTQDSSGITHITTEHLTYIKTEPLDEPSESDDDLEPRYTTFGVPSSTPNAATSNASTSNASFSIGSTSNASFSIGSTPNASTSFECTPNASNPIATTSIGSSNGSNSILGRDPTHSPSTSNSSEPSKTTTGPERVPHNPKSPKANVKEQHADETFGNDDHLQRRSFYPRYDRCLIPSSSPIASTNDGSNLMTTTIPEKVPHNPKNPKMNERMQHADETFGSDDHLQRRSFYPRYDRCLIPSSTPIAPPNDGSNSMSTTGTEEVPFNPFKVNVRMQQLDSTPKIKNHQPRTVAERHLPVVPQQENRRFANAMRLLEPREEDLPAISAPPPIPSGSRATTAQQPLSTYDGFHQLAKEAAANRSTNNNGTMTARPLPQAAANYNDRTLTRPLLEFRLRGVEYSFASLGDSIITNIDKSVHMVEEANRCLVERLRCKEHLKHLYKEINTLNQTVRQHEMRLLRMEPEIQANQELTESLHQRRLEFHDEAMYLGRGLWGNGYRVQDEGREPIQWMTRRLVEQTRLLDHYEELNRINQMQEQPGRNNVPMERGRYNPRQDQARGNRTTMDNLYEEQPAGNHYPQLTDRP